MVMRAAKQIVKLLAIYVNKDGANFKFDETSGKHSRYKKLWCPIYIDADTLFTLLCCSHVLRRFVAGKPTRITAFPAALNLLLLATGFKNPAISMM